MHELSIANQILVIVCTEAKAFPTADVSSATVTVGRLMAVEVDNLLFCLNVLKTNYPETANTHFAILEEEVNLFCEDCGQTTLMQNWHFFCTACTSSSVKTVSGEGIIVTSMEVDLDENRC